MKIQIIDKQNESCFWHENSDETFLMYFLNTVVCAEQRMKAIFQFHQKTCCCQKEEGKCKIKVKSHISYSRYYFLLQTSHTSPICHNCIHTEQRLIIVSFFVFHLGNMQQHFLRVSFGVFGVNKYHTFRSGFSCTFLNTLVVDVRFQVIRVQFFGVWWWLQNKTRLKLFSLLARTYISNIIDYEIHLNSAEAKQETTSTRCTLTLKIEKVFVKVSRLKVHQIQVLQTFPFFFSLTNSIAFEKKSFGTENFKVATCTTPT